MSKIIEARKRSNDPVQETLRQHKDDWNAEVRNFIAELNSFKPHLISFKRGLNGIGDPKAGLPTSDIKFPLPNEMHSYLSEIHSEFRELSSILENIVGEASSIMQEQSQYAGRRRKTQPKIRHVQPSVRQQTHPLQTGAQKEELGEDFIVEASNSFSRAWARASAWFSSEKNKESRLSMLTMAHEIFKNLIDLEDSILEKGITNIPDILTTILRINNNRDILSNTLEKIIPKQPDNDSPPDSESSHPSKEDREEEDEEDMSPDFDIIPPPPASKPTRVVNIKPAQQPETYSPNFDLMLEAMHKEILGMVSKGELSPEEAKRFYEIRRKYLSPFKPLTKEEKLHAKDMAQHIYKTLIKQRKTAVLDQDVLEKIAIPNILKKIFLSSKDPTYAARIEIYHTARKLKKQINKIMDLLEDANVDLKTVFDDINEFDKSMSILDDNIQLLHQLYENKYYTIPKNQKALRDPGTDPVTRHFNRQVRRRIDTRW